MQRVIFLITAAWILILPLCAAELTFEQRYLAIYTDMARAESSEKAKDYTSAFKTFLDCRVRLQAIAAEDPDWETVLIRSRLSDLQAKVEDIKSKTGDLDLIVKNSRAPAPVPLPSSKKYPWKTNIGTTMFYLDEKGAWDHPKSLPEEPGGRVPKHNPFYVALPFDDLVYPDLAKKWVPAEWNKADKDGKPVSACRHRWIEIKNPQGRICYAQWEDTGPLRNDHAEYVFGTAQPDPDATPGLNVSPAVATYLDLGEVSHLTSWRFVDNADVPPGLWLKYEEMAIIYRALHEAKTDPKSR